MQKAWSRTQFQAKKSWGDVYPDLTFFGAQKRKKRQKHGAERHKKGGRHELTKQKECRRMGFFHQSENGQNPIQ
jgi:hypothetical protein